MKFRRWHLAVSICIVLLSSSFAFAAALDLASVAADGAQGNLSSRSPTISTDGRFVAFESDADNLVAGDIVPLLGTDSDIFVRDLETGATELVSASVGQTGFFGRTECRSPSISGNGSLVAFECFSGSFFAHRMYFDIFIHDLKTGTTELASAAADGTPGKGGSAEAALSSDGRYLAFASEASNLVPGDANSAWDIFVRDREMGTVERIGGNGNSTSPALSSDGRYVAFVSVASDLVAGDANNAADVFVYDRQLETFERFGGNGSGSTPSLSSDGRYLAFASTSTNLVSGDGNGMTDIFVCDRRAGGIARVGGNGHSSSPSLSADGRYVAFASTASDLVDGDANGLEDIFLHDRLSGKTERITVTDSDDEGNGPSVAPALAADGRRAVFQSLASNLVANDDNGVGDIFVRTSTIDTTPPVVSLSVTPDVLWPPNKKYVDVRIDGAATDDSGAVTVEITLDDEYGEMIGMIVPGFGETVDLEAWREGDDPDGRVYTVTVVATDAAGNRTVATAEAVVPHDMRMKKRD